MNFKLRPKIEQELIRQKVGEEHSREKVAFAKTRSEKKERKEKEGLRETNANGELEKLGRIKLESELSSAQTGPYL